MKNQTCRSEIEKKYFFDQKRSAHHSSMSCALSNDRILLVIYHVLMLRYCASSAAFVITSRIPRICLLYTRELIQVSVLFYVRITLPRKDVIPGI